MQSNPQALIIWGSMGTSHLLITAVTFMLPTEGHNPGIAPFLVFPAMLAAGSSLALPALLRKPPPPLTVYILRWALAEAATLVGFLSYMFSGLHLYQFVCLAMALAAWMAAYPRDALSERR